MNLKQIFFIINLISLSFSLPGQISIVAHRGASAYELENSMASFKKALELNADAIELDIWKTTDDSLIVMHDQMTGRTANKNLNISTSTAKELRNLQLNNGEKIPFLQEVIEIVPPDKEIVIEIKDDNEKYKKSIVNQLSAILKESGKENNAVIISFNLSMLIEVKQRLPHLKCYYLSEENNLENELIEICKKYNFDGLDVYYEILTDSLVEKSKKAGLDLWTWTINDPKMALFARVNNKVSAITTNFPDLISNVLEKNQYQTIYYEQKRSIYKILPHDKNEVIFLGNGITDNGEWTEFFKQPNIKNRGISGDITLGVLARLNDLLTAHPLKIFILIGINDILRANPDSIILYNYQTIIEKIQTKSPETQIYIQSILPVNTDFKKYPELKNKTEHILYLNNKLKELCQEKKITYIDLYPSFCNDQGRLKPQYTNDGLHLMGDGYKIWIEILKPYVYGN
jgi:glycerophosphoryl diester phosphodiesterase